MLLSEYTSIGYFMLFSFILSILLLSISSIITFDSRLDPEKSSVYECGFYPFSETRYMFEVQFYLIAIMFLLFDIEILYLFPFVNALHSLSYYAITNLCIFLSLIFLGLLYEISRGILNFKEK